MQARHFVQFAVLLAISVAALSHSAQAATYSWIGTPGATWSTSSTNWSTSAGPLYWDLANGTANIADFTVGGDTPVVSGNIFTNGIQFDGTANISGGTINLVSGLLPTPTITVNATGGTIGSVLAGTAGFTKLGSSPLTLTGANTYSGSTTLTAGQLILAASSGFAIPGNLAIADPVNGWIGGGVGHGVTLTANDQIAHNAIISFPVNSLNGFHPNGFAVTIGGLSDSFGMGVTENTVFNGTNTSNGTLNLNLASGGSYTYAGYLRNTGGGTAPATTLALTVSGSGVQTLAGANVGGYTGGTTINSGTLRLDTTGRGVVGYAIGSIAIASGGTLELYNTNPIIDNANGGYITTANLTGNGTINKTGPGEMDIAQGAATIKNFAGQLNILQGTFGNNNTDWGSSGGSMNVYVAPGTNLDVRFANMVINTLSGSGTVGTSYSTTPTLTIGNNNGSSTFNGTIQSSLSLAGSTAGGSVSLIKNGSGAFTLAGNNSYNGFTVINGGVLNVTGTVNQPGNDFVPAYATTADSVVNVTGSVTASHLYVGNIANAVGALNLSGGTINLVGGDAEYGFTMGRLGNSYGYFSMTGGSVNTSRFQFGGDSGQSAGMGIGLMSGGIVNNSTYMILSRIGASTGQFTITGGTVNRSGDSTPIGLGWDGSGRAELNVAGGLIDNSGQLVNYGASVFTGTGILNLNAGTLKTNGFVKTTGTAYLNLNGGTLKSNVSSATFLPALTSVYDNGAFGSYAGGAVIDTNGFNDTIVANLLAPTGSGVSSLALTSSGSGYIGAPYVSITGAGSGATAIANMVDDGTGHGTFKIGSITITNPGVGYTGVPTYTLTGGGAATPATPGTVAITANTSGGLTKNGVGTLTLTGTNTYSGTTAINGGALQIGNGTTNSTVSSGLYSIAGSAALILNYNAVGATAPTWANISGAGTLDLKTAKNFDTAWGTPTLPAGFTGTLQIDGGRVIASGAAGQGLGAATAVVVTAGGQLGAWLGGTLSQNITIAGTGYGETNYESAIRLGDAGKVTTITGSVSLAANATIGASGGTGTIAGVISGSNTANLTIGTVGENGTIIFSNANTYAGNTTLSFGTLKLGTSNAVPITTSLAVNGGIFDLAGFNQQIVGLTGGATIQSSTGSPMFTVSNSGNFSGAIQNAISLIKTGTGTLILSGSNTNTGLTQVNGGVLQLGNGSTLTGSLASNVALSNNTTLTFANPAAQSFAQSISGTGSLIETGPGVLTLLGTNSYAGPTSINGGALVFGTGSSLPATASPPDISIAYGAALGGSGAYPTVTAWLNSGRIVTTTSGAISITANSSENIDLTSAGGGAYTNLYLGSIGTNTYSGTLTPSGSTYYLGGADGTIVLANNGALVNGGGARSLIVNGGVTITGSNSYSGGTTLNGGTLNINGDAALGAVPASPAVNVTFAGNSTLQAGAASLVLSASRNMTINSGVTASIDSNGNTITMPGVIGGAGGLAKVGNGTLVVSNTNTYGGGTTISAGILQLSGGNNLPVAGAITTTGGTLDLNGQGQSTSGLISFQGGGVQNGTLTQTGTSAFDAQSGTINAVLAGSVGLNKTTTGTVVLAGANTYSGTTTLTQGKLGLGATSGYAISGDVNLVNNADYLYMLQNNQFAPGSTLRFVSNVTDFARVELRGTTQTLAGIDSSATGVGIIENYEGSPGGPNYNMSTLILNGTGSYTFNQYLRNQTGQLSLIKNGTGTQTLSGANISYTGSTIINSGVLRLTSPSGFSSPTTINSGGTLAINGVNSGTPAAATYNLNGGVLLSDENGGFVTEGGAITLSADSTIRTAGTGTTTNVSQLFLDGGLFSSAARTLTLNTTTANNGIVLRNTSGAFTGAVVVNGQGLGLTGRENITSTTAAALAFFNADMTLNNGSWNIGLGSNNDTNTNGTTYYAKSLSGSGFVVSDNRANTLDIGTNAGSGSFSGIIGNGTGGGLSIVKIGPGTQYLSFANSYTGSTTVSGGQLALDFTQATSPASNVLSASSPLVLNGGSLAIQGKSATLNSQTTNGLTVNAGPASSIAVTSGGTTNLVLGTIARNAGGTVDFTLPASGSITTTSSNAGITGGSATILGGYATVGGSSWAVSGTAGSPYAISALASYSSSFAVTTNVDSTGASAPAAMTINSLRFNSGAASVATAGNLTIATGGVLETAGVGANAVTISGNQITSGNGQDLVVIQNNTAGGMTISSQITGAIALTKAGPGLLTLGASNSYSGVTNVAGGTLQMGAAGALSAAALNIYSGTLDLNGNNYTTAAAVTMGGGPSANISTGAGLLTLANDLTYNNQGGFSGGLISSSGTGGIVLSGARTFTTIHNFATAADLTIASPISGTGSLIKAGVGTMALSNSNTYSGGTTVSAGLLQLTGGNNSLNTAGAITTAGGTLDLGGAGQSTAGLISFQGGAVQNGTLTETGTSAFDGQSGTINAVLAGNVNLNKTTAGTIVLNGGGSNTYTGSTAIALGALTLSKTGGAVAIPGNVTMTNNEGTYIFTTQNNQFAPGSVLTLSGGAGNSRFELLGTTQTLAGIVNDGTGRGVIQNDEQAPAALSNYGNSTLVLNGSGNYTYNGYLRGYAVGTLGLTWSGSGSQTLSGANIAYTGSTLVTGNRLVLQNVTGWNSPITLSGTGSLIELNTPAATNSFTISNPIIGSGAIVKTGSGITLLSGVNSYTGGTTISGGVLDAQTTASLPGYNSGGVSVASGAVASVVVGGVGQWNSSATDDIAVALSGINFSAGSSFGIDTGSTSFTYSNSIGGSQGLYKLGSGMLVLSNSNSYTGITTVANGGTTVPTNPNLVLSSTSGYVINSDLHIGIAAGSGYAVVQTTQPNQIAPTATVYFDSPSGQWAYLQLLGNNLTVAGVSSAAGAGVIENAETISGSGPATLTLNVTGNNTFTGVLRNNVSGTSGALSLIKSGSGTQTFSGANITYAGSTNVNSGTLELYNASAYASATTVGSGAIAELSNTADEGQGAGATFSLNNGATLLHNGLTNNNDYITLAGAVTVAGATTINENSVTNTTGLNKNIFLDGGLAGSGTLTINAANAGNAVEIRNNNSTFVGTIVVNGIANTTVNLGSGIGVGGATTTLQNTDIQLNGTMELLNQGLGWAGNASGQFKMGALSGTGVMIGNFTGGGVTTVTLGNTNNSGIFSGLIANGTGNVVNLIKTGTGNQTFAGNNTYTGATTISGGTLQIGAGGNTGSLGTAATVTDNASLAFSRSDSIFLNTVITGSGNLSQIGPGSLTLIAGNSYQGGTSVTGGTLQLTNSASLGTGGLTANAGVVDLNGQNVSIPKLSGSAGVIVNNAFFMSTLTVAQASATTFSGSLQDGTPGVTAFKLASGTLTLAGNSTHSGGVTVSGGLLQLGNTGALGTGGLTANAGTVNLAGYSTSVASLSGSSGVITNSSTTAATLDLVGFAITTFSGSLRNGAGNVGLQLDGTTLTLAGSNTHGGPTTINSGSLIAAGANVLSSSSAMTINGGLLDVTAGSQSIASLTAGGGATLDLNIGNLLTSLGAVNFNGMLNITGSASVPNELIAYPNFAYSGSNGIFSSVSLNGSPLSGYTLAYTAHELDLVAIGSGGIANWNITGGGSWTTPGNWSSNSVPNGQGVTAILGSAALSPATVTLDGAQTLGSLIFNNSNGYTLIPGAAGSLTMNNTGGTADASIVVLSGTHSIAAPLTLSGSNTAVSLISGGSLDISGSVADGHGGDAALTLSSSDGTGLLSLSGSSNSFGGGMNVQSGTLILNGAGSLLAGSSLTIGTPSPGAIFAPPVASLAASPSLAPVPEPGTLTLFAACVAAIGIGFCRRKR